MMEFLRGAESAVWGRTQEGAVWKSGTRTFSRWKRQADPLV